MFRMTEVVVPTSWHSDVVKRIHSQISNRKKLESSEPFSEAKLRSLDSSLKKTTAVTKKLKMMNRESVVALLDDVDKINLSKFVEEMAVAVAEAKVKTSEIPPIVDLCVAIGCRYDKFAGLLLSSIRKAIPAKKSDKISNPSKLRVDLSYFVIFRLLSDLFLHGLFGMEALEVIGAFLKYLVYVDKQEHLNCGTLVSLLTNSGWELADCIPGAGADEATISVDRATIPQSPAVNEKHRDKLRKVVMEYYQTLVDRISALSSAVNRKKKIVHTQERTRGDASVDEKSELDRLRGEWTKWNEQAKELSRVLGVEYTEKDEESDHEEEAIAVVQLSKALEDGSLSLWPDQDSRIFYEQLYPIRRAVHPMLYKDSTDSRSTSPTDEIFTKSVDEVDMQMLEEENDEEGEEGEEEEDDDTSTSVDEEEAPSLEPRDMKERMDVFLADLSHMANRDNIDEAAVYFVQQLNTSINCRRLSRFLLSFSQPQMIPFYCRLLATIEPVMRDFVRSISASLVNTFREILQKKCTTELRLEKKIACVLFISELVKFGVLPRAEALVCLRLLVYDFRGHCIEMTAAMVECCGVFLYRNTDTHAKMSIILDVIQKKRGKLKDARQVMLLENAHYAVLPPPTSRFVYSCPPLHRFIRWTISNISDSTILTSLRCIRRIDWTDTTLRNYTLMCLSSPWLVHFSNVSCLASFVGGLADLPFHNWIGVSVVDNVLENIRLYLENPVIFRQVAMSSIIYLGELYSYCICNSNTLFKTLYQLISFPEVSPDWKDTSRIRLSCHLVDTVSEYFQNKSGGPMICFLAYFQRFYWMKREEWKANAPILEDGSPEPFPLDVIGQVTDMHKKLSTGKKLASSLEEAEKVVADTESSFQHIVAEMMAGVDEEENGEGGDRRRLGAIQELTEGEVPSDEEWKDVFEEEEVTVHTQPARTQEDDEMAREFDRLLNESTKPPIAFAPVNTVDMTVPAAVKNKSRMDGRVAILTHGKGNKVELKTVNVQEERLEKAWRAQKEREKHEREQMKRLTLAHSLRQEKEEEELSK